MKPISTLSFFRQNCERYYANFQPCCEFLVPVEYPTNQPSRIFWHVSTAHYLAPQIKEGSSFLDVGCGWGGFAPFLHPSVSYHGIDFCPQMLEKSSAQDNAKFYLEDIHLMPFRDETFDYVLANESLFFCNVEIAHREIHRVLKPQGIFYTKMWLYENLPENEIIPQSFYCCTGIERDDPNVFGVRHLSEYEEELDKFFNHKPLVRACLAPNTFFKIMDFAFPSIVPHKVSPENPFKHCEFTPEERKKWPQEWLGLFKNQQSGNQNGIFWSGQGFRVCSKK